MRSNSAEEFTHVSAFIEYPVGGCAPYSGIPMFCNWRIIGFASLISAPLARKLETTNSNGVFTFARYSFGAQNSGEVNIVLSTSRISPSFFKNVCVILSTRLAGGSSQTKRPASFVEMNFAVDGL